MSSEVNTQFRTAAIHGDERVGWDLEELSSYQGFPPLTGMLGGRMLTRGTVAMLAGQPGVGKTWLALKLADAVVNGSSFAGLNTERGRVLFISEEMTAPEIRERLLEMHRAGDAKGLRFRFQQQLNLANWWKGGARLREILEEEGKPELVIIDAFRDVHTAPENNNDAMASLLKGIRDGICRPLNCCVLLIHHYGRPTELNQGGAYRGASTIEAIVANMFLAELDKDDKKVFKFKKTRRCKPLLPCEYELYNRADNKLDVVFSRDGESLDVPF